MGGMGGGQGRPSWPQDPPGSAPAAPELFSEEADGDQEGGGEAGKGFRLPKSAGWALQRLPQVCVKVLSLPRTEEGM